MSDKKVPGTKPGEKETYDETIGGSSGKDSTTSPGLENILLYARLGFSVLPVQYKSKAPVGKLVPHGLKDASRSPKVLKQWFCNGHTYNIGIVPPEHVVIIDIDPRAGGEDAWRLVTGGNEIATLMAKTGGGGRHLFYSVPKGFKLPGKLGDGVDVKVAGKGYVVAAPSIHPSGGVYEWLGDGFDPDRIVPWPAHYATRPIGKGNGKAGQPKGVGTRSASLAGNYTLSQMVGMLSQLDPDDYGDWVLGGQCFQGEFGEAGFEHWAKWGLTGKKGRDEEQQREKWSSFRNENPDEQRKGGSLAKVVRERGGKVPDPLPEEVFDAVEDDIDLDELLSSAPKVKQKERHWPQPINLFEDTVCPSFPLEVLPTCFQDFCSSAAEQSGFDPGGYAFTTMLSTGNLVDHRSRMTVAGSGFRSPAFAWGGLVDFSGGGKSNILRLGTRAAEELNQGKVQESVERLAAWREECKGLKKEEAPSRPVWRQRIVRDFTVESLGAIYPQNPEGINVLSEELSETVGRLEAYSGRDSGKDRGTLIKAFDGVPETINRGRSSNLDPIFIEHFSLGILSTVQPDKLADLYRRGGSGGADGLFQRFMLYVLARPKPADYSKGVDDFAYAEVLKLSQSIQLIADCGGPINAYYSHPARKAAQDFDNAMREVCSRMPESRYREHLRRFAGFLNRLAFTLHIIRSADLGLPFDGEVSLETFRDAKQIISVLYRHSEAAYTHIEGSAGDRFKVARQVAEMLLSRELREFPRGELTRSVSAWRGLDSKQEEAVIDLLIEYNWIADATPASVPGRRGRKSEGYFLTNPLVFTTFEQHSERLKSDRKARYEALRRAVTDN